jgi:hypothetical protein
MVPIFLEVVTPRSPAPGKAVNLQRAPVALLPSLKICSNRGLLGPLMGNSASASQAAAFDDILPVGRSHTNAKSVGLLLMAVIRLVGPFHCSNPFKSNREIVPG